MQDSPHRKRVRHFRDGEEIHELTFSCFQRRPLLTNNHWRTLLLESIDRATHRHRYRLTAYVLMPEHVHLVVYPDLDASKIHQLLTAIKRPFSYRIKQLLVENRSSLLQQLTVRQRPGVSVFRYWQEGPGYDRNLQSVRAVVSAIEYVHLNPVRRGLVELPVDWEWSSARWYSEAGPQGVGMPRLYRLPAEWLDAKKGCV